MYYLVGVSHFAKYGTNRLLIVGELIKQAEKFIHVAIVCVDASQHTKLQLPSLISFGHMEGSHGSVTSVVRATHQVNGRGRICPSHHTYTP